MMAPASLLFAISGAGGGIRSKASENLREYPPYRPYSGPSTFERELSSIRSKLLSLHQAASENPREDETRLASVLRPFLSKPEVSSATESDRALRSAKFLTDQGFSVRVRQSMSTQDPSRMLSVLRHTFLEVKPDSGSGVIVVDPSFREQFVLALPNGAPATIAAWYGELLALLPPALIMYRDTASASASNTASDNASPLGRQAAGETSQQTDPAAPISPPPAAAASPGPARPPRLEAVVRSMASAIRLACAEAGIAVAPWRRADAILTKWDSLRARDLPLSQPIPIPANPSGAAGAAKKQQQGQGQGRDGDNQARTPFEVSSTVPILSSAAFANLPSTAGAATASAARGAQAGDSDDWGPHGWHRVTYSYTTQSMPVFSDASGFVFKKEEPLAAKGAIRIPPPNQAHAGSGDAPTEPLVQSIGFQPRSLLKDMLQPSIKSIPGEETVPVRASMVRSSSFVGPANAAAAAAPTTRKSSEKLDRPAWMRLG